MSVNVHDSVNATALADRVDAVKREHIQEAAQHLLASGTR